MPVADVVPVSDFSTKLNVTISSLKPDMSPQAVDADGIHAVNVPSVAGYLPRVSLIRHFGEYRMTRKCERDDVVVQRKWLKPRRLQERS